MCLQCTGWNFISILFDLNFLKIFQLRIVKTLNLTQSISHHLFMNKKEAVLLFL